MKDVSVVHVFSVPLTPSIAGSVVIWYCIVDNSPVGTQERDMVESVVPFSVTFGHGGRPSVDKTSKSLIFKWYV